ncbi:hypothetical protein TIFTF001_013752 [Ficus carica]|uniref:Uncharacterized protein n=1 Tax=Ficus carica TaxID=3494 RepID=A0AA88D380_FICCA|nr:hypothetical protein TIFTF001_013752 [Ficus carica]
MWALFVYSLNLNGPGQLNSISADGKEVLRASRGAEAKHAIIYAHLIPTLPVLNTRHLPTLAWIGKLTAKI